jgi:hypothetical protein
MEPKGSLVFTKTRHWSVSAARCIQSTTSHPVSICSILILPFIYDWVYRVVLPFTFLNQNIVHISHITHACYMPTHLILLHLITLTIFGQSPVQWVPGVLSLGVKRLGREVHHSLPYSADVNNAWTYTSTPPIHLHGVAFT